MVCIDQERTVSPTGAVGSCLAALDVPDTTYKYRKTTKKHYQGPHEIYIYDIYCTVYTALKRKYQKYKIQERQPHKKQSRKTTKKRDKTLAGWLTGWLAGCLVGDHVPFPPSLAFEARASGIYEWMSVRDKPPPQKWWQPSKREESRLGCARKTNIISPPTRAPKK